MRTVTLAALLVAVSSVGMAQAPQAPANFDGRWRLTSTGASPEAADTLLVTQSAPPFIGLERGYPTGVRNENYSLDPSRRGFYRANWMGASLVLTRAINAVAGGPPPRSGAEHQEVWTILPGDVLNIDVTDRSPSVASVTTHLSYKRVPLQDAIVPGQNLLENPDGAAAGAGWLALGDAKVESCDGNPCFVLRNRGNFHQTVPLPPSASGKYVVLIGSGAAERINPDGAITGLPSIHAIAAIPGTGRTLTHFGGQQLFIQLRTPNEWTTLSGVFVVPVGAVRLSLELNQAERRDVPQNGSATRFDHVGVFLFSSESDARAFIAGWRGR